MANYTAAELSLMCWIAMILRRIGFSGDLQSMIASLVIAAQRELTRRLTMYRRRVGRVLRRQHRWFIADAFVKRHGLEEFRHAISDGLVSEPTRHLAVVGQPEPVLPEFRECVGPDSEGEDSTDTTPPASPTYDNSSDDE